MIRSRHVLVGALLRLFRNWVDDTYRTSGVRFALTRPVIFMPMDTELHAKRRGKRRGNDKTPSSRSLLRHFTRSHTSV